MAVGIRSYGTVGRRVGMLTPNPYQTRRAMRAVLAEVLERPLEFAAGRDDLPCQHRDVDPEMFFPTVTTGGLAREAIAAAKAICLGSASEARAPCPVQQACRQWALDNREYGVWGGTSEGDRELLTGHRPSLRTAGVIA